MISLERFLPQRNVFSHVMECTLLCSVIRMFGIRSQRCFRDLVERVTIRVLVYIGILCGSRSLDGISRYISQFSFVVAVNLSTTESV